MQLHPEAVSEFRLQPHLGEERVPAGDGWLHEPKLDGYRLQVAKDGHTVRLYGRRVRNWSKASNHAVWTLITSSNIDDCKTRSSAGMAPLRMRPT